MAVYTAIILLTLGLRVASYKTCPANSVNTTRSTFGAVNYVQLGVWHRLPCTPFRPNEALTRVIWYKQDSPTDRVLITHKRNADYPESDRYAFWTSGFGLVIKRVEKGDRGMYVCQVIPRDTLPRLGNVSIQVIGDTFPGGSSWASSAASFQRGRRQTLPCECAGQAPGVVYWSTGEGVTSDTQIIGARFADGATLQIQHGADYSIGSDASLTVNSLSDVQDTQRYWCHVFQSDGSLSNCDTNTQISDDDRSARDALKASERSFYLRTDARQTLPCVSWSPGDAACEVEWSQLDNPDPRVLCSYNLSTGVVDSGPEFDLGGDFGLVIRSVGDEHAGEYRCVVGNKSSEDVEVRVIGDHFPLDGGIATEGDVVIFKPESIYTLRCPVLTDISLATKATLFWSSAAPDAESSSVIGTLNPPDGPTKMSDPGDSSCLDISMEGALTLDNCSQNGDVRYWCHVFPEYGYLARSYVDVVLENANGDTAKVSVVIIVCVLLFVCVLVIVVVALIWRRKQRRSSKDKHDTQRGDYKRLAKQARVVELDLITLETQIKSFVSMSLGRIPITPWISQDDACFAPRDAVYKPLEMFVNVLHGGSTVKYRLDPVSGIFDDGFKRVIVQGRPGSGKTTFLNKLIYDWAVGKECNPLSSGQVVVLVPAWLLIQTRTIGQAVVKCMLPKDAGITAESINAHYARDQSNLTILIDDCNDSDDFDAVMKVVTDNEFCGQFVLTTRNAELAKAASQQHSMRHVTITGFTLASAIEYVDAVLETAEDRRKSTPEHKAVKSGTEAKSSSIVDSSSKQKVPQSEESSTVPAPPETKGCTVTGGYPDKTEASGTPTPPRKPRNLHRYLEEDILPPDVSCLPAALAALCQLSIWTKGDAFKPDVTMANLFFRLVKCLFDRMRGLEVSVTEGDQLRLLTDDQVDPLAVLGRVAYAGLVDSCGHCAGYPKGVFLRSEIGEDILRVAIKLGLVRPLQVESGVGYAHRTSDAVLSEAPEVEIRTDFLCWNKTKKPESLTGEEQVGRDTELTPLTSPDGERFCFVLEILEHLCVGVFLAQTTGKMKECLADIEKMSHSDIIERFSNVFLFAIQDNQFDREAPLDFCLKIISRGYSQDRPLRVVQHLQNFVELCLKLNFEGQWEGAFNKKLKSLFPKEKVQIIGISSYKLRLLSYLLEHAQPEDKKKLNVKSLELLRIGRHDWSELQEYMGYFAPGQEKANIIDPSVTKPKDSLPTSTETRPSSETQTHSPSAVTPSAIDKPLSDEDGEDNKPDDQSLSEPKATALPIQDGGDEDRSTDSPLHVDMESFEVIAEEEAAFPKQLRERIESSSQDMPRFPPDESGIRVLHTVQSLGLQDVLESQAGRCSSSGAARDMARYLPRLENLESLVLIGTILSSEAICDLAKGADKLKHLKKLDLRLNRHFDDRAFVAVTNLLLRECKEMTDLRLSLYRVRDAGFDEVERAMGNNASSWGRLKTLYLLHGSPAETFVRFLSNCLKYFHFVERFHISATYKQDEIPVHILEEFEQTMKDPKIMTNLKALDITNIESLKKRTASLKLPKKQNRPPKLKSQTLTCAKKAKANDTAEALSQGSGPVVDAMASLTGVNGTESQI